MFGRLGGIQSKTYLGCPDLKLFSERWFHSGRSWLVSLLSFSARLVPFLQCQGKIIAFCGTGHDAVLQILKVITSGEISLINIWVVKLLILLIYCPKMLYKECKALKSFIEAKKFYHITSVLILMRDKPSKNLQTNTPVLMSCLIVVCFNLFFLSFILCSLVYLNHKSFKTGISGIRLDIP